MFYGYARVSSKGQQDNNSFEQQENEIKEKYPDAKVYREQFTGTTVKRPVLDQVMKQMQAGDTLVVTKLDRLARNTIEGIELISTCFKRGQSVHVMNVGLLDDTMIGEFFLTVLLAVAQMERKHILERTQNGKAIAKMKPGFREGRPKKYSKEQIEHALSLLDGASYRQVVAMTGISKSTLVRARRERE